MYSYESKFKRDLYGELTFGFYSTTKPEDKVSSNQWVSNNTNEGLSMYTESSLPNVHSGQKLLIGLKIPTRPLDFMEKLKYSRTHITFSFFSSLSLS